ncbi:hypothetical protein STEG23_018332 [Scotinomys teguina]
MIAAMLLPCVGISLAKLNSDTQGSMSGSVPPSQQGFQASEVPARSQDSLNEPRKQQKNRTVFTLEQKLVLQEHYEKCIYVSQDQCMALAQRFGLKEHIIKVWFKNRRAKEKQKKARQVTGEASCGSPSRPSFLEGCATPATSVSADSLCQRPECSPDQESNLLILGQDPEEGSPNHCFSGVARSHNGVKFSCNRQNTSPPRIPIDTWTLSLIISWHLFLLGEFASSHSRAFRKFHGVLRRRSGSRTDEFGRNRRRLKKFHGKPGCGSHHSPTFQEESMSPGTSTVVSIPKTNSSLEASVHDDQNLQDAGCSPQEDLLDGQALTAAPNPRQPTVVEAQTDPSMTEGSASVEAPVPTTAAARGP